MTNFLEIALRNAARGWYVFPLVPNDKFPRIPKAGGGRGFHDATLDAAQITEWWTQWPHCNIGIWPGASGMCVLDVDTGLTDFESFEAWRERNGLPKTFSVRTGRRPEFRVQMYFQGTREDCDGWELDGCQGDIRSMGGYVCAIGSVHPSGYLYEPLYPGDETPLAAMPEVVARLKTKAHPIVPGEPFKKLHAGDGRHADATSEAGRLRNKGLEPDQIAAALIPFSDARHEPPLPFADIEHIARSIGTKPLAAPEPKLIIGKAAAQPEPAPLAQRNRPNYPIEVWDGTAVGEFARLCADDNNIPRKIYAESFRCALGAVVGDRISCPVEGALPRSYTIIIAPKGKGKGTGIRRAVRFFSQTWRSAFTSLTPGLLSGERDFMWKPKGIGAWMAAASSVPGMARLTKDLESTIKAKPLMVWGNTLPRILSVHEEMKTFLSALFIEGGVGSGMEGVVCQLWDDVTFNGTATGTREAVYGEMLFSLLAGVTEEDWFDILSRGNAVGGGLMSRLNLIGTEGQYENVSRINNPDFSALQEKFLPRVRLLEDVPARILPSDGADKIIGDWQDGLAEGSERMNVHAWRSALLLAWLRNEDIISAKTAEDATRLAQYQVDSHDYYRTKAADTPNAKVQGKILRALEMKGQMFKRKLQQVTHAQRDGTELWNRALEGLLRDGAVGKQEDGAYYLAAEGL